MYHETAPQDLRELELPDPISASRLGRRSGRPHVETHMFDVARLVDALEALRERFDLLP